MITFNPHFGLFFGSRRNVKVYAAEGGSGPRASFRHPGSDTAVLVTCLSYTRSLC